MIKERDRTELRRMFYETLAMLYRSSESIEVLEYPEKFERQSVNIVVRLNDGRSVLFKIAYNIDDLSQNELSELKSTAAALNASAAIVARRWGGRELLDSVVYERKRIPVMTPASLSAILEGGSEGVYVYQAKDVFKVRINSVKMRERRLEKKLSLGDIALHLNTSRKLVYEYERGLTDPTIEKGEKLAELLGEDVIEPVNPFEIYELSDSRLRQDYDSELEARIARILDSLNFRVSHAKRTAADIVASLRERRMVLLVRHSKESESRLLRKADNAVRMSRVIEASTVALVDDPRLRMDLEPAGIKVYKSEEITEFARGLDEARKASDNREAGGR